MDDMPGERCVRMIKCSISFPTDAMQLTDDEIARAGVNSRAVIEQATAAGVYVIEGGIDEGVDPVLVAADGSIRQATYPGSKLDGGFTDLERPNRQIELTAQFEVSPAEFFAGVALEDCKLRD